MSTSPQPASTDERNEIHSALFAQMVMQQTNLALMFLGATPHPETGKTLFDLDAAQMFIAQLDMLEAKTNGNLSPDEAALLKQSLTTVRMAFVQAVNSGEPSKATEAPARTPGAPSAPDQQSTPGAEATPAPGPSPADDERKKFVKKY